jgi:PhnB protein
MNVNPYVQFGGRCAEAFEYYKQHLGATDVVLMTFAGSPGEAMAPPEWRDKVIHGALKLGAGTIMGTDGMPGQPYNGMQGCALALAVDTPDDAERMFGALSQGGKVTMPMAASFFAQKFGMVTDQFGVAWMVICEAPH